MLIEATKRWAIKSSATSWDLCRRVKIKPKGGPVRYEWVAKYYYTTIHSAIRSLEDILLREGEAQSKPEIIDLIKENRKILDGVLDQLGLRPHKSTKGKRRR